MYQDKSFRLTPFITLYSVSHFAVDASCAYLLLGALNLYGYVIVSILIYNGLAFALQAPLGYIIDKALSPKLAAITGLLLVATSFLFIDHLFAALTFAGLGNALFHVGAGSMVLSLKNKRATFSGVYVAPGGIGLVAGSLISVIWKNALLFPAVLISLAIILFFIKNPEFKRINETKGVSKYGVLVIFLILFPIAIRSLLGLSIEFPWKENQSLLVILTAAIAFGKIFGGVLADRFGLMKIGVGGLLISIPFLSFFSSVPALGILGACVFNFTMPITLIAISDMIPAKKGLSFGLTTVAIFLGALPVILGKNWWIKNEPAIIIAIISASIILYVALRIANKHSKDQENN